MTNSVSLANMERFDLDDFHVRWQKARKHALLSVVRGRQGALSSTSLPVDTAFSEREELGLLGELTADELQTALRLVFDNSRDLGRSLVRYLGATWELDDLAMVLNKMPAACFAGGWQPSPHVQLEPRPWVLHRAGCGDQKTLGSSVCDYWREAVDGLVMGVGDDQRFARQASVGHGDSNCVDVLFAESVERRCDEELSGSLRWLPVPPVIVNRLTPLQQRLKLSNTELHWDGFAEGVLYYHLSSPNGPVCGTAGRLMHQAVQKAVGEHFATLCLQDTGPLAVYGSGT